MNTAITNQQNTSRLNRREFISYCFLVCLVLFGVAVLVMLLGFAIPQQPAYEVYVGKLSDFPAYATPHFVDHEGEHPFYKHRYVSFYIVNTGSEIIAFDSHPTHYYARHCRIRWVDITYRFEDPCYASRFEIDGTLINGPASRNLDRFPVRIENGEVWVDISKMIFGAEVCDHKLSPSKEICIKLNELYKR